MKPSALALNGAALVIDHEAAIAAKNAEGLLDPPSLRLDFKPGLVLSPDQLEVDTAAGHRVRPRISVEGEVGPNLEERAGRQLVLDQGRCVAVLHECRHDLDHMDQAFGVDQQHPLSAFTFLFASYSRGPACGPVRSLWVSRMPALGGRLRPRARRRQPLSTASPRSSTSSLTHRSKRLPMVCHGG
jgi:hypothetical protein